jgi:hypothetical protein
MGIGADRHITYKKNLALHNSRGIISIVFVPIPEGDWKPANSDHLAAH